MAKYFVVLNREVISSIDDFLAVIARNDSNLFTDFPKVAEFDETDPMYHFTLREIVDINPRYVPLAKKVKGN